MSDRIVGFWAFVVLLPVPLQAAQLTLAWDSNPEGDIAGYRLHYGTQPGAYTSVVDVGASLTHVVGGLLEGQRYYFSVQAYNASGLHSALSAEIDGVPPDVTVPVAMLTNPTAGIHVSGTIDMTAAANDNVALAGVTFTIDGLAAGPEDASAPFVFSWDTTTIVDGAHTIVAIARDAAGNLGPSPAIMVEVANATSTGPGLIAALGFDEGHGRTAADSSGHGHHADISGAAWRTGLFGYALGFDGINDWVTVGASEALNFATAMTLEAWVYPTAAGGWRTIVFKEAPAEVWGHTYGLYSVFGSEGPGGHVLLSDYANVHDAVVLPLDRWSHIAATYDGTTVRFFLNGTERLAMGASGQVRASEGVVRIGGNAIWSDFFQGRIDEVRLYDRALSAAEIQTDMSTPVTSWLVAAYSFDDGSGSTVKDAAGRSLTGTVSGATWTTEGRFGSALKFDGVDDRVTVGHSPWLDLPNAMTLEAWVYPTAGGGWRTVMLKTFGDWYTYGLYADGSDGPTALALLSTDASARARTTLPLHTWSHLAATFDGAVVRLFINGVAVASTPPIAGPVRQSTEALEIGGNSLWGEYFTGTIDEVRIYYRALTAAEIQADMGRPIR